MTTRRLAPDKVKACYNRIKDKGWGPASGSMIVCEGRCCGLAAFYLANHNGQEPDGDQQIWDYVDEKLGPDYVAGYWKGFDGVLPGTSYIGPKELTGFNDGRAAAILMGVLRGAS